MTIIAVIFVLIGAIVAVKYRERTISQYIYSLILILLFLLGTLFPNSPFNLITRLSSGAMGVEALAYCGLYAALALPFYFYAKKIQNP